MELDEEYSQKPVSIKKEMNMRKMLMMAMMMVMTISADSYRFKKSDFIVI